MRKSRITHVRGLDFPIHSNGDMGKDEFSEFMDQLKESIKEIQEEDNRIIDIKYSTIPPAYRTDSEGNLVEPHYQGEYTALIIYESIEYDNKRE